jgi:glycerophosphoryl diester phosphodiesterase
VLAVDHPIEVVAHRGACAHAPEHTLLTYDLALELGADVLEVDLRLTADRELVVLHDATLARTAGDPRPIATVRSTELASIPFRRRPLPFLEVLDRYAGRVGLLLELKDPTPAMERRLLEALGTRRLSPNLTVQSFDEAALGRLHALEPSLTVAPLRSTVPEDRGGWLDGVTRLGARAVGLHHTEVDAGLVAAAHLRGLAVRAWTVNHDFEAGRLARINVDGVITDAPGRIRAARDAQARSVPALAA